MLFDETVKSHIFAERFGGSLYTRFNQGQLQGEILKTGYKVCDVLLSSDFVPQVDMDPTNSNAETRTRFNSRTPAIESIR